MVDAFVGGISELPPCAAKGCSGKGFILIGNKLFCANCLVKYDKAKKEKERKEVDDILNSK